MRVIKGLIVAAAVIASSPVAAKAPETLRICFEDWKPYAWVEAGKPTGLVIELVDQALKASGRKATYEMQPYQRCLANVDSGAADAILMSSDEDDVVAAPTSIAHWEVGVIAGPGWPADSYRSLADFNGAAVGLIDSYEYHPEVTAAQSKWKVTTAADELLNLRMAAAGRVDVTLADVPWTRAVAAEEGLNLKVLSPVLLSDPQYVYFRSGLGEVAEELGKVLRKLVEDGSVDRLYRERVGYSFSDVRERAGKVLLKH